MKVTINNTEYLGWKGQLIWAGIVFIPFVCFYAGYLCGCFWGKR